MHRLLARYRKEEAQRPASKLSELLSDFGTLEVISEIFNFIIQGEIKQAKDGLERLKDIPILPTESGSADKFYQQFEKAKLELKWLLLDSVVAAAKCIYIEAIVIIYQSPDGQLQFEQTVEAEKNRSSLKRMKAQLRNLGNYIDSILTNKSFKIDNPHQAAAMEKRVEEIGSLIRKVNIEIQ